MPARSHPMFQPHPSVELVSNQRVWDGRFPLDVIRFRHRRFDGAQSGEKTWEVWRRGRAAAVLPYDPVADAVVLIEQFRLPALVAGLDPILVELPAGLCDEGEMPEVTARRETTEEMGLEVTTLRHIGAFLLTPGGADELCDLYAGRVIAPVVEPDGIAGHAGMVIASTRCQLVLLVGQIGRPAMRVFPRSGAWSFNELACALFLAGTCHGRISRYHVIANSVDRGVWDA
jgi:ADP-ribose pyrophosphatase